MNKKTIAIIVGIVAVLAVIAVSIWGITAGQGGSNIPVTGVNISNPYESEYLDGNTKVKRIILDNDATTFQILATVLPKNATNKTITYTSSDTDVATVSSNGLVTFLSKESVLVTLVTADGGKTMAVNLIQPAGPSRTKLDTVVSTTGVTFATSEGEDNLIETNNGKLILLSEVNYEFDTDAEISVSETDSAVLTGKELVTSKVGEFNLKFKKMIGENLVEQTATIKVVPYVHVFAVGSNYLNFKNIIDNVGTETSEFMNAQAEKTLLVGTENNYRFNISMDNNLNKTIDPQNLELSYDVNNGQVQISDIATLNNDNSIKFLESAIGNTYTIKVTPKYNITNKNACTYVIKINKALNVWTHEQLKAAYANLNVTNINILSGIEAKLDANQINADDGTAKNFHGFISNGNYNYDCGSPYMRGVPITYTENIAKSALSINGNYYTVDGSKLPMANAKDRSDGQYGSLDWMSNAGYKVSSVQVGMFNLQDDRGTDSNIERLTVNYSNLKLVGNTSKSVMYNVDEEGNIVDENGNVIDPGSISGEEIYKMIAKQGSGLAGFMSRSGVMNFNNVSCSRNQINFWQAYGRSAMKLDYVNCFDAWANGMFGWATTSIELYNTKISNIGGGAIALTDATNTTETSPAFNDATIVIGKGTTIDNFLSGTEGWFVVNGFTTLVPALKTTVNDGIASVNKTILKRIDGESKFNFIIQNVSSISHSDTEVRDFQNTIKIYLNDDTNGNPIYNVIEKRNPENTTFLRQHPLASVFGGQYINAMGKYSNLQEFYNEMAVISSVQTIVTKISGGGALDDSLEMFIAQKIAELNAAGINDGQTMVLAISNMADVQTAIVNDSIKKTLAPLINGTIANGNEPIDSNETAVAVSLACKAIAGAGGTPTLDNVYETLMTNELFNEFKIVAISLYNSTVVSTINALKSQNISAYIAGATAVLGAGLVDSNNKFLEVIAPDARGGSGNQSMQLICEFFNK